MGPGVPRLEHPLEPRRKPEVARVRLPSAGTGPAGMPHRPPTGGALGDDHRCRNEKEQPKSGAAASSLVVVVHLDRVLVSARTVARGEATILLTCEAGMEERRRTSGRIAAASTAAAHATRPRIRSTSAFDGIRGLLSIATSSTASSAIVS